jgi:hypothetical protein
VNYKLDYKQKLALQKKFVKKSTKKVKKIQFFFCKCAYNVRMDKRTAIELAGGVLALAKLLGVSRPAIYQWKNEVPKMRVFQLKTLRPEWFS